MTRVNMSTADRLIRLVVIAIIGILLYTGIVGGWLAVMLGLLGFAFLVSSMTGFCPLYVLLRVNTARRSMR